MKTLIAAYGGDPMRWPEDERDQALTLCHRSATLQQLIKQQQKLDGALDDSLLTNGLSVESILEMTTPPARPVDATTSESDFWNWLLPTSAYQWWKPAVLASAPLLLGIVIGVNYTEESTDWSALDSIVFSPVALGENYE
ncbi:conserved hypothetical protein [Luminiphilus syltensis NOR5-1B]|uniref:Uncharacterized protein n=1 Tax=Luminiphilus syltensis NOR5-1B TaxID=565045 RepID=B8KWT6_9GAMM|nr:conserved hypothetical protein [Luminiphilus syltensis NOR5-1B]